MGIVSRPAQYSYQTGSPAYGEQRNTALKTDFAGQIDELTSKLPGHVQEHIKRQRALQTSMGEQTLAVNRGGNIVHGYKIGPS